MGEVKLVAPGEPYDDVLLDYIIELQDGGQGFAAQILIEERDVDPIDLDCRRSERTTKGQ